MNNIVKRDHDALCKEYNEACEALGINSRMLTSATRAWMYIDCPGARLSLRWADAVNALEKRRKQLAAKQADEAKLAALKPADEPRQRYKQMDHSQFRAALDQLGIDAREFAWLTGADHRRTRRWLKGEEPSIPHWVTLVCTLLDMDSDMVRQARVLARAMHIPEGESV